jgi:hypothetical protein
MTGSELIDHTRFLVDDRAEPQLWPDSLILRYLQEAESLFCRMTHVYVTDDTVIKTVAGQNKYEMPSNVLRVIGAVTANNKLAEMYDRAIVIVNQDRTGEPKGYSTGLSPDRIVFYPVPDAEYEVTITAASLPDYPLRENSACMVVPNQYQFSLADYAAYRLLTSHDIDEMSQTLADKYERRWQEGLRDAKRSIYLYRTPRRADINSWTGGK